MAIQRRRRQYTDRHIPAISTTSAAILLLFVLLYLFAPAPLNDHHFLRNRVKIDNDINDIGEGNPTPIVRVPNSRKEDDHDIWSSNNAQFYYGCSNASRNFAKAAAIMQPNRYLAIATSGGLNQQRTGITDAVVAARILNATLVVPILDKKSFWNDDSDFSEIFDVEWFISYLAEDIQIVKELPQGKGPIWNPYITRVPRKCNKQCYISRLVPVFTKKHVIQLTKFDYRLSNRLETDLQKLRCRVNYHALKFTDPILEMGLKLVHRMRMRDQHYIALHLRFEADMLAFSGCYYGGGDKERMELSKIRRRWKTLHIKDPDKGRRQGRCPLTPEEVGLLLRALGYDRNTHIYVASGEIYGGETTLAPLKALFPNLYSKDTIASKEELEPFSAYSSRMAALDFIVCDESDVFVTNNNGNMAKILAGKRRYFGHKPTIRPNAKKLYSLILNRHNMTWEEFALKVRKFQRGFMGEPLELKPSSGVFHENPAYCICEDSEAKRKMKSGEGSVLNKMEVNAIFDYQNTNEEREWSDHEQGIASVNETSSLDYNMTSPDEPDPDVLLFDF